MLPLLIGGGISLLGSLLGGRAQKKQNNRLDERTSMMDEMARKEMEKKEFLSNILLPSLLQGMGNRNPQTAQALLQRQQPPAPPPQGAPMPPWSSNIGGRGRELLQAAMTGMEKQKRGY